MSILLSGDFHANAVNELAVINREALVKQYGNEKFSGIKYHIILGDAGFMWPGNRSSDRHNYSVLAQRPFPILCVIGNHEPILGMSNLTETDIGLGETVYQINNDPFTAYFKRGKIYLIEGFKALVLGGALSNDKAYRTPGLSWWEREYWTEKEKQDLFYLLERENTFDIVLSHTGPNNINKLMLRNPDSIYADRLRDEVAFMNDQVDNSINCLQWWCGHWHRDRYFYDEEKKRSYQFLYHTTRILERQNNEILIHEN